MTEWGDMLYSKLSMFAIAAKCSVGFPAKILDCPIPNLFDWFCRQSSSCGVVGLRKVVWKTRIRFFRRPFVFWALLCYLQVGHKCWPRVLVFNTTSVISRHSRAGGNPFLKFRNCFSNQGFSSFTMDSRLRGNDGMGRHAVFKVKYVCDSRKM